MASFTPESILKRNRVRIDVLGPEESVESKSIELLSKLKNGEITVSDLMGPLYGVPDRTPVYKIPPGDKSYFPSASDSEFYPKDEHNVLLEEHVHPNDYVNPEPSDDYDLVAIGAGVSGLISVIIGAWLGKKCALIEKHAMGGDCLNIGCVPSKALIACARAAHSVKELKKFGVHIPEGEVTVDFPFVMKRMREIRARISHHDSVQRYSKEFCKHVFVGEGKFIGNNEIEVTGDDGSKRTLKYKKAMIATGASAAIPPVAGLREIPHLTNANFFNLNALPPRMIVIGCGPIGLELSQSLTRMGSKVMCFEMSPRLLPREDPDASKILQNQLEADGVEIYTNIKIVKVELVSTGSLYEAPWSLYKITIIKDGETVEFEGEAILNATGRAPNVYGIGLETVGVEWDNRNGVHINDYFQTANPDIYACGDCATPYKFTHSADFQARIAIRNMFLEPEVAHVGKYEDELINEGIEFETFTRQLKDVDRCMCDGVENGFVKITVKAGTDEIIGATICGPNAGDMISELTMAIQYGIGISEIAGIIHPYPTTQEAIRQACLGFNKYYKNPAGVPLATLRLLMEENEQKSQEK
eukprot:gene19347-25212_t